MRAVSCGVALHGIRLVHCAVRRECIALACGACDVQALFRSSSLCARTFDAAASPLLNAQEREACRTDDVAADPKWGRNEARYSGDEAK
eukprot:5126549-Pleurochrysis_carterae.AAC.1